MLNDTIAVKIPIGSRKIIDVKRSGNPILDALTQKIYSITASSNGAKKTPFGARMFVSDSSSLPFTI
jgi:hypothetical protein